MKPLEVRKITKYYNGIAALKNMSFSLTEGEIFGLLGPNGAGKTTLISIITSLEKQNEGEVQIFGENIFQKPTLVKSKLGVVPQEIIGQGFFNVQEILHFISGFHNLKNNKEWISYLLHKLELYPHRKKIGSHLSGGMKRRLMIAKALVHKPKLLLLDEPTAGVDIDLRQNLWEFILELNKEGMTILLTTHYLEEAEQLCDRIGVIHLGKLLKLDRTQTLIEQLTKRRITFTLNTPKEVQEHPLLLKKENNTLVFEVPKKMQIAELLQLFDLHGREIKDIQIHEGSLEDAFRNIIGGGQIED